VFRYRRASPPERQIEQPVPIVTTLSTQVAQKWTWPHGTSATPSRCPIRHASQQLSAAAGVAADVEVLVPVAAAGNAVVDGRSSASSSSLEDSLWRGCGTVCALTLCIRSGVEPWNACFDALLVHQILFLDGARSETIASITPSTL